MKEFIKEYGLILVVFIGGMACVGFLISKTEEGGTDNTGINNQVVTCPVYSLSQDGSDSLFVLGYKIIRKSYYTSEYLYFNRLDETGKQFQQKIKISGDFLGENKVELCYSDTARLEKIVERSGNNWRLYVPKTTQFKGVIELGGKIIISDKLPPEEVVPENHTTIIPIFCR